MNLQKTVGKESNVQCNREVLLQYFRKVPGLNKFKYDHTDTRWIDVDTVITTVTLEYSCSTDVYTLATEDVDALNEFVTSRS